MNKKLVDVNEQTMSSDEDSDDDWAPAKKCKTGPLVPIRPVKRIAGLVLARTGLKLSKASGEIQLRKVADSP